MLQNHPDTVFLEFSINDSVARFDLSVEKAKANLENMISRILKANPNCEIILMTITPTGKNYRKKIPNILTPWYPIPSTPPPPDVRTMPIRLAHQAPFEHFDKLRDKIELRVYKR